MTFKGFRYSVDYPEHNYVPRIYDFCKSCSHCHEIFQYGDMGTMRNPDPCEIRTFLCDAQLENRLVLLGTAGKEGYPEGCPSDILESKLKEILKRHNEDLQVYADFLKSQEKKL